MERGGTQSFGCLTFVVFLACRFTIKGFKTLSISVWVEDSCYSLSSALVMTKHCLVLFAVQKMKLLSEAIKCSRVTWTAAGSLSVQIQSSSEVKSTQNHSQAEFRRLKMESAWMHLYVLFFHVDYGSHSVCLFAGDCSTSLRRFCRWMNSEVNSEINYKCVK